MESIKRFRRLAVGTLLLLILLPVSRPIELQAQGAVGGVRALIKVIRAGRSAASGVRATQSTFNLARSTFASLASATENTSTLQTFPAALDEHYKFYYEVKRKKNFNDYPGNNSHEGAAIEYYEQQRLLEENLAIKDWLESIGDSGISLNRFELHAGSARDKAAITVYLMNTYGDNRELMGILYRLYNSTLSNTEAGWEKVVDALNKNLPYELKKYLNSTPLGDRKKAIGDHKGAERRPKKPNTAEVARRNERRLKNLKEVLQYKKERLAAFKELDSQINEKLIILGINHEDKIELDNYLHWKRLLDKKLAHLSKLFGLKEPFWHGDLNEDYAPYLYLFTDLLKELDSKVATQNKSAQIILADLGYLDVEAKNTFLGNEKAQTALLTYLTDRNAGEYYYDDDFEHITHWHLQYLREEEKNVKEVLAEFYSLGFGYYGRPVDKTTSIYQYLQINNDLPVISLNQINSLLSIEKDWLSKVIGGSYLSHQKEGDYTYYFTQRSNGFIERIGIGADGSMTRVEGVDALICEGESLSHIIQNASDELLQFAHISGFVNDGSKTIKLRIGKWDFEVNTSELRAFLDEEKSQIRNIWGESFDAWVKRKLPEASHIVFYQDPVLGSMNFTYETDARLLTEVENIYSTGLNLYNPQKLVAQLNAHYADRLNISLTNDLERARNNIENAIGPLTADQIALSHDMVIEDYDLRKRIQRKLGKSKINQFELGDDLSPYKALIFSGHKDENFRQLLHQYGQEGDLKGKVLVLLTCYDMSEVAFMNQLLDDYEAREVLIFDQELRGKAVENTLLKFSKFLKRQKGEFQLSAYLRKATNEAMIDERLSKRQYFEPLQHVIPGKIPD